MKKRFQKQFSLVLCVAMLLGLLMPVMAADPLTVSLSFTPSTIASGSGGQILQMDINISPAVAIIGASYTVKYDHDKFSLMDECFSEGTIDKYTGQDGESPFSVTPFASNETVSNLGTFYFEVPNGLNIGEYVFTLEEISIWLSASTILTPDIVTQTLEVTDAAVPTATFSGPSTTVVNTPVTYSVEVTGQSFSAAELNLKYDPERLRFDSLVGNGRASAKNGVLTIADYGSTKSAYTYQAKFTPIKSGATSVELQSAAMGTADSAADSNLTEIALANSTINVTVNEQRFPVTLPIGGLFSGVGEVEDGGDYTFTIQNYAYYEFTEIKAVVGDTVLTVIDNQNGTWTVKNVTGPLVITAEYTPKYYEVTSQINYPGGKTDSNVEASATYGNDYDFTLINPEHYTLAMREVIIADAVYEGWSREDDTISIPGSAITGDIVIIMTATQADAAVTVQGSGAGDASGYTSYAKPGTAYTLKVRKDSLYRYTVTAEVNNTDVAVTDNQDGTYTISGNQIKAGSIVFTVEKTLKTEGFVFNSYLTIDDSAIWLVRMPSSKLEGRTYTYNEQPMFWSEGYKAYCCLVIADTQPENKMGLSSGTATEVIYDYDANKTGRVDANDAQFVYNIYNVMYSAFTDTVTMEKLLRADVNADRVIDINDATAIINQILGNP